MTIRHSSIHLALGETGDLDYPMIQHAVETEVREDQRLDWKSIPYESDKKAEFVKDVAALANAQGGLIVIGVSEKRPAGSASAILPFNAVDDARERQMRLWLHNQITPPVSGVEFLPLVAQDGDTDGVLVVAVLASANAPHFVDLGPKGLGVPYRVGTQTHWMREPDIERAYRQRFDRVLSELEHLDRLSTQVLDHLEMDRAPWLIAVARPFNLRGPAQPRLTQQDVQNVLSAALRTRAELKPENATAPIVRSLDSAALNPRPSLRSWVAAYRRNGEPEAKSAAVHVVLHDDGSVVLAAQATFGSNRDDATKNEIHATYIRGLATDLVALTAAVGDEFGIDGEYLARVTLARPDDRPYAFVTNETMGGYTLNTAAQPFGSIDVRGFIPVESVIPPALGADDRRQAAVDLANDIASQFGVSGLPI